MAEDETRLEVAPRGTPAWHFAGNITLSEKSSGNDKHRTGSLVTRQRHRTGPLVTREGPAALERGRRRLFKLVRADGPRKRAAGKRPSLGSDPVSQELDPGALCRARSHLLQAVTWAGNSGSERKVLYLTAEKFMYGFVAALKTQTALAFKEALRGIDVLVIDDLQFLQGKSTQAEFCHTLNALIDAGRQVVIAADRPPSDLESLDDRVRSRLAGGLVVEMGSLGEELRLGILKSRAVPILSGGGAAVAAPPGGGPPVGGGDPPPGAPRRAKERGRGGRGSGAAGRGSGAEAAVEEKAKRDWAPPPPPLPPLVPGAGE